MAKEMPTEENKAQKELSAGESSVVSPKKCLIVYSTKEDHINNVIREIKTCSEKELDIDANILEDFVPSGNEYIAELKKYIDSCCLGIVILDGLRPNIPFEYGMLEGAGVPTLVFKDKEARVDIRSYFPDSEWAGLCRTAQRSIINSRVKLDPSFHLSDIEGLFYEEYDWKDLDGFRSILKTQYKTKEKEISDRIKQLMTKDLSIDLSVEKKQIVDNIVSKISKKIAMIPSEVSKKDKIEIDNLVKNLDYLIKELRLEMPAFYYSVIGNFYGETNEI